VHICRRSSPSHSRHTGVSLVCDDSKCSVGQSLQFEQKCQRCEPSPPRRRKSALATASSLRAQSQLVRTHVSVRAGNLFIVERQVGELVLVDLLIACAQVARTSRSV